MRRLLLSLLILFGAPLLFAQSSLFGTIDASVPTVDIRLGDTVIGELTATDAETEDGSYIDWYSIRLGPDDAMRVELRSDDFDTYLVVRYPDGTEQTNDDWSFTDSALEVSGADGELFIGATSFGLASTGSYTISVEQTELRTIEPGGVQRGVLDETTVTYELLAEPGSFLEVVVRSDDFDTYLEIEDSEGNYFYNDDAGNTSTSRIYYTVADDGLARIIVSSWGDSSSPSYEFTLEVIAAEVPEDEYPSGYELSDGETISTQLVPMPGQGDYVEKLYTIEGSAGERLELELRSDAFDSFLTVYGPSGQLFEDDDSAGNLDSLLSFVAPEDGIYEVVVSSLGGDLTGPYTLSFARLGMAEIILNQTGELSSDDEQDIDGRYYDTVEFQVSRGEQVVIELNSDEFDAFLTLWLNGEFITRDDDGGAGSNSRLLFTPDESGRVTVYITTFSAGDRGGYTISVYR